VTTSDVLIIGGGLVGCSVAVELAALGASVTVVERHRVGAATSGVNQGGTRQQFQTAVKIRAAKTTIEILSTFKARFGADIDFWQNGYLFALSTPESAAQFRAAVDLQRSFGIPTRYLSPTETVDIVPGIRTDDLVGATYCPTDGRVDPRVLMAAYAAVARRSGVSILEGEDVRRIVAQSGRVQAVETRSAMFSAGSIINACGPWAPRIAALCGAELPIQARSSSVYLFGTSPGPFANIPLTIDADRRVTVCPRSDGIMIGSARKPVVTDPPAEAECDWTFADIAKGRASHRIPALTDWPRTRGWAGFWEVTPDDNPIIGWTHLDNLFTAAGFSGHGMSIIPGLARSIAQQICRVPTDLPLDSFDVKRFANQDLKGEEIWGGTALARFE
jgi:glycine/D-amino acid oxidase-like deaminating enzyme